jgi:valyl-tRNA synthetase
MGKRHQLEFITVIGKDARLTDAVPEKYRGLDARTRCRQVVADSKREACSSRSRTITHNVGHCQRSGVIIEPLISTQWFMRMKPLAEPALAAVLTDERGLSRRTMAKIYCNWLENIEDWCISRLLWWGHRIPAGMPRTEIIVRGAKRKRASGSGQRAATRRKPLKQARMCSTPGFLRRSGHFRARMARRNRMI